VPARTATVGDLLLARADDDRPGLLFEDGVFSWRDVVQAGAARAALADDLRPAGPFHIGVLLDNVPEYVFWIAAAGLRGATIVGINPTRRGAELAADIRHSDCGVIVTDTEHWPLLDGLDLTIDPKRIVLVDDPGYRPGPGPLESHADPGQLLMLLFTSGSTGAPKAVICTQGRMATIASTAGKQFAITADDVLYESMPMFHGNAIMANWLPALGAGATVALARRFSASNWLPDVRKFGATYFNYVGRALAYILATPETPHDRDHRLTRGFGTEASAIDMERFTARFGVSLIEGYGSTEGVIRMHREPGCPPAALGIPPALPGFDVAVVDPETGAECAPAEFDTDGRIVNAGDAIGELVNRAGAPSFEGYYRNEEATTERLRNGWYWSGDLAYRDAGGWFYFAGRNADWLRVDSENFAAAPVERVLARYPGAVMVAVYPVPDARTGDQVMAAVEMEPGHGFDAVAFGAFLDGQTDLGTKWSPRYVRVVDAIPLLANNKVDKRPLRTTAWSTSDPVWWRPGRENAYVPFTADDERALRDAFSQNGRTPAYPHTPPAGG
jgi:fatty-acyl-CoA synthase